MIHDLFIPKALELGHRRNYGAQMSMTGQLLQPEEIEYIFALFNNSEHAEPTPPQPIPLEPSSEGSLQ